MNNSIIIAAIVVFALTLLTGLILFIRGIRGRWLDSHPYCRKCRYNLTGQTSEKCPECGTALDQRIVAFRVRKRRRPSLILGAVLLLISIGLVSPLAFTKVRTKLAQANWCRFYTLSMLLTEAERNDVNAFDELFKRVSSGKLSRAKLATIGDRAIAAHDKPYAKVPMRRGNSGTGKTNVTSESWCNLILKLNDQCPLTDEQKDRFFNRVAGALDISARKKVVIGQPLPLEFERRMRGSGELMFREACTVTLDGESHSDMSLAISRNRASGNLGNRSRVTLPPDTRSGAHQVEVACKQVFRTAAEDSKAQAKEKELAQESNETKSRLEIAETVDTLLPPLWSRTVRRGFEVEITPPEATATVDAVKTDAAKVKGENPFAKVRVSALQRPSDPTGGPKQTVFSLSLDIAQPLERCTAYVVVAILEGREIALGSIAFEKGMDGGFGMQFAPSLMENIPEKFDNLIFRPSKTDAEKTTDCFEVTDEVIEFGPISVTQRKGK